MIKELRHSSSDMRVTHEISIFFFYFSLTDIVNIGMGDIRKKRKNWLN